MPIENIFIKYIKLRNKLDNGKIYQIVDNTNNNVYIGSTCKTLKKRLAVHKSGYKRFLNGLFHNIKSFDILKNNDYKIELLEDCEIKTKQELVSRERFYIKNNECVNNNIPGRYDKGTQQYHKEYYETNKEKLEEKIICQCRGHYTYANKSHHIKTAKHQKNLESQNK